MSGSCPICQRSETHVTADSGQEMNRTECCVCGRFRIPNESPMAVATALQTPMNKAKLTRMIHKENDAGRVPILTTEVVEEALRMTLPQKQAMADELLRILVERCPAIGKNAAVGNEEAMARLGLTRPGVLQELMTDLERRDLFVPHRCMNGKVQGKPTSKGHDAVHRSVDSTR